MKVSFYYVILFFSATLGGLASCNEDSYVEPIQLTTIRGQVRYSINQQPVRNALVKLMPTSRIVPTDSAGMFRFDSVLAGKYTVQASLINYGTEVATVETTTGSSPLLTILLTDNKTLNRPPTAPALLAPAQNSVAQSTTLTLRWSATDLNRDSLSYDLLLFRAGLATPERSYTGLSVDSLVVESLAYNTTYLWQVIVKDGVNTVNGTVWSFQTAAYPSYPYAFVRRLNGQFQLFMGRSGSDAAQLTFGGSNWRPIVSPNNRQIAYISNVDTDLHLYVMNVDGSGRQRITTVPIAGLSATDLSFCWSPDGTQLLYPSNANLYAVRTDGTGLRRVAQAPAGQTFAGCDWSGPAGRIVARLTTGDLYNNTLVLIAPDGGTSTTVLSRPSGRLGNPVFSIDGRQLLFSYDVSGFQDEQGRQLDARLFLLTLATGVLVDLSTYQGVSQSVTAKAPGTNDLEPRFSPNGAKVIFTNVDNTGTGVRNVLTVDAPATDATGGNRTQVLTQAEMPYWR